MSSTNNMTPFMPQGMRVYSTDGPAPKLRGGYNGVSGSPSTLIIVPSDAGRDEEIATFREVSFYRFDRDDISATLKSTAGQLGGGSEAIVVEPGKVFVIDRAAFNQGANAQYPPHIEETDVMDTLVARGPHAVSYAPAMERL